MKKDLDYKRLFIQYIITGDDYANVLKPWETPYLIDPQMFVRENEWFMSDGVVFTKFRINSYDMIEHMLNPLGRAFGDRITTQHTRHTLYIRLRLLTTSTNLHSPMIRPDVVVSPPKIMVHAPNSKLYSINRDGTEYLRSIRGFYLTTPSDEITDRFQATEITYKTPLH